MALDTDKIDDAALALHYLTLHDGVRAWKGMDLDVLTCALRCTREPNRWSSVARSQINMNVSGVGIAKMAGLSPGHLHFSWMPRVKARA
jgi:hypothetical protein